MQMGFGFGAEGDIALIRGRLGTSFGTVPPFDRREPINQLVRSLLGSRTRDAVSLQAYCRLVRAYPRWPVLAQAAIGDIQRIIAPVTYPDKKTLYLRAVLRSIAARQPDFDLQHLGHWPVDQSLSWLELLPGIGRKIAAATLNFSILALPAFVVDTHVLRVLRRFGLVGPRSATETAYAAVMAATPTWSARDLSELHVLLKHLGQTVCHYDQPECRRCPLQQECRFANRSELP